VSAKVSIAQNNSDGSGGLRAVVNLTRQNLKLMDGESCLQEYRVSTSRYGPGEVRGSECTPRGKHVVRAMIGAGVEPGSVFVGRRPSGEVYDGALAAKYPERDWVLTRILWLSGVERGRNRLGNLDTMRRYIYIHGCPDTEPMGVPYSHGCVRMENAAVIDLFNRVEVGMLVDIQV
jgi:L,D-transpeptidase YbiS